jgi:L-serine deaminase
VAPQFVAAFFAVNVIHRFVAKSPIANRIPCVERNAMVAMKVINASRSAFRESGEHEISLDPVIETTYRTGLDMQSRHKETFLGDSQQHRALILGRDRACPGFRDIRPHWHRWPQCSEQ